MIEIGKDTLRYKAYRFGDLLWNKFMGRDWDTKNMTDTCSYFRTFLFKVPLVLAINIAAFWWILNCLIFWPIQAFGLADYSLGFVKWSVIIFSGAMIVALISVLYDKFKTWLLRKGEEKEIVPKKPSLFVEHYKGFKNKFCPMLNFVDKETSDV